MTQEEFLLHYGVKGMKWGVRRSLNRALKGDLAVETKRTLKGGPKQALKREVKQAVRNKKVAISRQARLMNTSRKIGSMSNKELDRKIKRLQTENKIKALTKDKQATIMIRRRAKKLYNNKEQMSTEELKRKLARLQKERLLSAEIKTATGTTRKLVKAIAETAIELKTGG